MPFYRFISYLFHPISYPTLASIFYFYITPHYLSSRSRLFILTIVITGSFFVPILLLFIQKKTKMIQSFHLEGIDERKYPLILFSFLGFLLSKLLFKTNLVDDLALYFLAGSIAMLIVVSFLWLRIKVSIHTLGLGSLIGFFIRLSLEYQFNFLVLLATLFTLFGLVAKSRLVLKAHNLKEVMLGVVIGLTVQLIIPYLL